MEITSKGKQADLLFIDAKDYPGAWKLSGSYKIDGNNITINYRLRNNDKKFDRSIKGESGKLDALINNLLIEVKSSLAVN